MAAARDAACVGGAGGSAAAAAAAAAFLEAGPDQSGLGEEDEVLRSSPLTAVSDFLFLLRRKFPLSNILSQFGSRVQ